MKKQTSAMRQRSDRGLVRVRMSGPLMEQTGLLSLCLVLFIFVELNDCRCCIYLCYNCFFKIPTSGNHIPGEANLMKRPAGEFQMCIPGQAYIPA